MSPDLLGSPAHVIAGAVRTGRADPRDVVAAHLQRIRALDPALHAFRVVREEAATAEAAALVQRDDLSALPLAGVPVAVKDNVALAGEVTTLGSRAFAQGHPARGDDEVVRRLRAAGAVVVGQTRCPELCLWGATDGHEGPTRNPWELARSAGGSSGGSAAAVAAGLVPVAHGSDGLGSIRIPAAACGLVGLKPGRGAVPMEPTQGWFGMAEHGPLATTVADVALTFDVMAGNAQHPVSREPAHPLRIGVAVDPPQPGLVIDRAWSRAALDTAVILSGAGHRVEEVTLDIPVRAAAAVTARWLAAAADESRGADAGALERRTRMHARAGRLVERLGLVRERDREPWRARVTAVFDRYDVLLTPTLARDPLPAAPWADRSWAANVIANVRTAPLTSAWNLAGVPALAVPVPSGDGTRPRSVQLIAPEGDERVLLALAAQLEDLRPWARRPVQPPVLAGRTAP